MRFQRVCDQPNGDTFQVMAIGDFVARYMRESKVSIDPFARNCRLATYTNDLNPDTAAQYHLDAQDFLELMVRQGVFADLIIFDPPYSPRQIKELYDNIGLKMGQEDAWRAASWGKEKRLCHQLLKLNGVFLHFGWDSSGMPMSIAPGYEIEEILLVNHGACHSDTICMAQRKKVQQFSMFDIAVIKS